VKEILRRIVNESASALDAHNEMREYLQARTLACLQREGAMIPLAFHGGTALHIIYSLPRFSENLDFALEGDSKTYDIESYAAAIRTEFAREGYALEVKTTSDRVVNYIWIRFQGLPHEIGVSAQEGEIFSLKVEVDTRPPEGAGLETTIVRRQVTLNLQHHDRASLLAGKIHAILNRSFTKGRDMYDLLWYLSDPGWPAPNLILLNNALSQTGWDGPALRSENWREVLHSRVEQLDWRTVREDVAPFLQRQSELDLLTRENVLKVLGST
jgi:hypothetical protein